MGKTDLFLSRVDNVLSNKSCDNGQHYWSKHDGKWVCDQCGEEK